MNIGWQEFLGFYTGLNVQRKQHDEKYVEQKGIGEEIEDPNNSGDEEEPKNNQPDENIPQPRLSVAYKDLNENKGGKVPQQAVIENKPKVNSNNVLSGINDTD
jgi:hypothetical protein